MEFKVYDHSDLFFKDNKDIIIKHALVGNLIWANAMGNKSVKEGFRGYRLSQGNTVYLATQSQPFPMVNFCFDGEPGAFARVLAQYLVMNKELPDKVNGDPKTVSAFSTAMEELGKPYTLNTTLNLMSCDKVLDIPTVDGEFVPLAEIDENLGQWRSNFSVECGLGDVADDVIELGEFIKKSGHYYCWVVDSKPVTMGAKLRPIEGGMSIGAVYTPKDKRCKGYSTACIKNLTQSILDEGLIAYLYADKANPISNHVYEKIGYKHICEFVEFRKV